MRKVILLGMLMCALPMAAQHSSFDDYKRQMDARFDNFVVEKQAEFDAYRKRSNEAYAEFMRQSWESFPAHEADEPVKEREVPPVVYEPKPGTETNAIEIASTSQIAVVPKPQAAPEPIAPVKPKKDSYK